MKDKAKHSVYGYRLNAPLPYMITEEDYYRVVDNNIMVNPETKPSETEEAVSLFKGFLADSRNLDAFPQISEDDFVRYWLPHFYKLPPEGFVPDPDQHKSIVRAWINQVARKATNVVNVIRDGRIIFRVPPALGRMGTLRSFERTESVSVKAKQVSGYLTSFPNHRVVKEKQVAESSLSSQHGNKTDTMQRLIEPSAKYLYVLNDIFTYYGYESILPPEIMSLRDKVLGERRGTIQDTRHESAKNTNVYAPVEDDDDLFDD